MSARITHSQRLRKATIRAIAGATALFLCAPALCATNKLTAADEAPAFMAAGFSLKGNQWRACDDPTPTYIPGAIQELRDINGDANLEAVITEGGSFCYGNTGAGYGLVSKQADGDWKLITTGTGILSFLTTTGVGSWPDIQIGRPGFCFPVERWNGSQYTLNRHEYEGKPCRAP
jgi:hypothetical protein